MNIAALFPNGRPRFDRLPSWAPAALLLLGTLVLGPALGSVMRPLFVLGSAGVAWWAWRESPAAHLRVLMLLFAFAPFLRRLVDVSAGYDPSGIMLIGPLLAMIVPAPRLLRFLDGRTAIDERAAPILMVSATIFYAAILSMFQGNWMDAASGSLKWGAPLVYAASLLTGVDRDAMLRAASSAFVVILPIIGLYGIAQYVDPPEWDRYWMKYASIMSAGQPVPYGVRVFGTLNGPASYATFIASGLLVIGFMQRGWLFLFLAAPAVFGLLLSLYRTAWIALAAGIAFCAFFAATRSRASAILVGMVAAGMGAAMIPPFSDVIVDRIATLGQGSQDGSARERVEQYLTLWNLPDSGLVGLGFTTTDVGSAGAMPIDGMIIACWLVMGIVGGLICLVGFGWSGLRAMREAVVRGDRTAVVLGALAFGSLVQLPLANLGSAELGLLFWTFTTLAVCRPGAIGSHRP